MVRIRSATTVLLIGLVWVCTASERAALPQEARFYSERFAPVYADSVILLQLSKTCRDRFPKECGAKIRQSAPELDDALHLQSLIQVFDTSQATIARDAKQLNTADEVYHAMARARDSMLADLLEYDKDLLARYRALRALCAEPGLSGVEQLLLNTSRLDLQRFWSLAPEPYAIAERSIEAERQRHANEVESWSNERCVTTRDFGRTLIKYLRTRLQPFEQDGWQTLSRNERLQYGGEFIWKVALAFQATVEPDISKRIEASAH